MTGNRETQDVLLVEDNPGDVRLIQEAFEGSGVDSSLTVVTDGEEALEYLYQRGSETAPDLILLDLNVPKINGTDILEKIGSEPDLRSIPVFVLTSSESRDDIRETYELGADGYFVKPVNPKEFMSLVRMLSESLDDSDRLPPGEYAEI